MFEQFGKPRGGGETTTKTDNLVGPEQSCYWPPLPASLQHVVMQKTSLQETKALKIPEEFGFFDFLLKEEKEIQIPKKSRVPLSNSPVSSACERTVSINKILIK